MNCRTTHVAQLGVGNPDGVCVFCSSTLAQLIRSGQEVQDKISNRVHVQNSAWLATIHVPFYQDLHA